MVQSRFSYYFRLFILIQGQIGVQIIMNPPLNPGFIQLIPQGSDLMLILPVTGEDN